MSTPSPVRLTEQELVERWRAEALERPVFTAAAFELAARTDVDLHVAAELLARAARPSSRCRFFCSKPPPKRTGLRLFEGQVRTRFDSVATCIWRPAPRFDPLSHTGVVHIRAAPAPHVRAHAARRDPRLHLAHGKRWTAMGGDWELSPVWPCGASASVSSAPALPRHHVVERGPEPNGRGSGGLEGGVSGSGRDPPRTLPAPWSCAARAAASRSFSTPRARPAAAQASAASALVNQELYGKPTDLPWGLKIDSDHRASPTSTTPRSTRPFSTS